MTRAGEPRVCRNVGTWLRNPGLFYPQNGRIHIRNPSKSPRFLNQVPILLESFSLSRFHYCRSCRLGWLLHLFPGASDTSPSPSPASVWTCRTSKFEQRDMSRLVSLSFISHASSTRLEHSQLLFAKWVSIIIITLQQPCCWWTKSCVAGSTLNSELWESRPTRDSASANAGWVQSRGDPWIPNRWRALNNQTGHL